jgi:hypothetical protein
LFAEKLLPHYFPAMKVKLLLSLSVFATVLALLLAGCATKPQTDWNSRVGNFTYDQAVVELGPPVAETKLSDGRRVGDWVIGRSGSTGFSVGFGSFGRHTGVGVSQGFGSGPREKILRLTFGADGNLGEWKRQE